MSSAKERNTTTTKRRTSARRKTRPVSPNPDKFPHPDTGWEGPWDSSPARSDDSMNSTRFVPSPVTVQEPNSPAAVLRPDPARDAQQPQEGGGDKAPPPPVAKSDAPAPEPTPRVNAHWHRREKRLSGEDLRTSITEFLCAKGIAFNVTDKGEFVLAPKALKKLTVAERFTDYVINQETKSLRLKHVEECERKLASYQGSERRTGDTSAMEALLADLKVAKDEANRTYTMENIGMFEGRLPRNVSATLLHELLYLTRALRWLAKRSIDPELETRRGTIAVFSDLQSVYCSQPTLHELLGSLSKDARIFRERFEQLVTNSQVSFKEFLTDRVSRTLLIQRFEDEWGKLATLHDELFQLLESARGAEIAASHMGCIAFEHTRTILQLRDEIRSLRSEMVQWTQRASSEATACQTLAEENLIMAETNRKLHEHLQKLHSSMLRQQASLSAVLDDFTRGDRLPRNERLASLGLDSHESSELASLPSLYSAAMLGVRQPLSNKPGAVSLQSPASSITDSQAVASLNEMLQFPDEREAPPSAIAYMHDAEVRLFKARRHSAQPRKIGEFRTPLFDSDNAEWRKQYGAIFKDALPIPPPNVEGVLDSQLRQGVVLHRDHYYDSKGSVITRPRVGSKFPVTFSTLNELCTSSELAPLLNKTEVERLSLHISAKAREAIHASGSTTPKTKNGFTGQDAALTELKRAASANSAEDDEEWDSHSSANKNRIFLVQVPQTMLLRPVYPNDPLWESLWWTDEQSRDKNDPAFASTAIATFGGDSVIDRTAVAAVVDYYRNLQGNMKHFQILVDTKRLPTSIRKRFFPSTSGLKNRKSEDGGHRHQKLKPAKGKASAEMQRGQSQEWNFNLPTFYAWRDDAEGSYHNNPLRLTKKLEDDTLIPGIHSGRPALTTLALSTIVGAADQLLKADASSKPWQSKAGHDNRRRSKGKGKQGKPSNRKTGSTDPVYSFLMLPHPASVNPNGKAYTVTSNRFAYRVLVHPGNWATLRLNTKTKAVEYFPGSYLQPSFHVPELPVSITLPMGENRPIVTAPLSTIMGEFAELRSLVGCQGSLKQLLPDSSRTNFLKEKFRNFGDPTPSGASDATGKETARKRIAAFLHLGAMIPPSCDVYNNAVELLDCVSAPDMEEFESRVDKEGPAALNLLRSEVSTAPTAFHNVLAQLRYAHVLHLYRKLRPDYAPTTRKRKLQEVDAPSPSWTPGSSVDMSAENQVRTPSNPRVIVEVSTDDAMQVRQQSCISSKTTEAASSPSPQTPREEAGAAKEADRAGRL